MKTFAIFLLSKETFTIRTCSILESFFRKLLSKATFERKLSSVSLPLPMPSSALDELWPADKPMNNRTTGISGDTKLSTGRYRYQPTDTG